MPITFRPLSDAIGAEALGLDFNGPVDAHDYQALRQALANNSILLFRTGDMTSEQQIAFSRNFGDLEHHVLKQFCLPGHPEIYVVSNVIENGKYIGAKNAGEDWHSDLSFMENPSLGSALRAIEVPPVNGETGFTNMYAAYDDLDGPTKRRIENLRAVHSFSYFYDSKTDRPPLTPEQRSRTPDVTHPLVRTNQDNGRKALYVSSPLCPQIVGMPEKEGRALIEELVKFATQPKYIYTHRYEVGDMILWDNRSCMHRAMGFDMEKYRRVMHRTTIVGDGPPV